ncbi:MAG: glycoside hydrolase domain-containing protein, partial [Limisphaerales bacterium]
MKRLFALFLAVAIFSWMSAICARANYVDYVDPSMGGQGFLLEPTRPTVSLPNSMVRVYPVRKDQLDDQIHSFPLTIISHRLGELFWLMPAAEIPNDDTWNQPAAYDQEVETPYYYSARFDDSLIQTEFTPTARCGYFRFTFPSGKPVVLLANRQGGELSSDGDNNISGSENILSQSDVTPGVMHAYVYGEFSAPVKIETSDIDNGKRLTITAMNGTKVLEFRYGISFISVAQAKKNLQEEIPVWNFDKIKRAARDRWNEVLGQIQIEGGTLDQKKVFYTSLYRCYERMVCITEDGQYYSAF